MELSVSDERVETCNETDLGAWFGGRAHIVDAVDVDHACHRLGLDKPSGYDGEPAALR